jgi:hypothetical protein
MAPPKITRAVAGERRRRYFIDPQVQGALLRQAIFYWLWASATFALISFVYRVIPAWLSDAPEQASIWRDLGPYTIASVVLFPIVIVSAIRFSNRFAGPMVRIRSTLRELAQGETPPPLTLRSSDFWSDIGADINVIAAKLGQATPSLSADTPVAEKDCAEALSGLTASFPRR